MSGAGPAAGADLVADLVETVRDRLAREPGDLTPHRVAAALRGTGRPVGDATVLAVHEVLRRDVVGAGPLEPLLRTPGVTDVLVNGAGQTFLDRGHGLEPAGVAFGSEAAVRRLAQRLASTAGRRLDDATPHVDVRLPDGTRFHAVLAPVARPGTVLSLRVPRARSFTLEELVAAGSVGEAAAQVLRELVAARAAFLVSGGTSPVVFQVTLCERRERAAGAYAEPLTAYGGSAVRSCSSGEIRTCAWWLSLAQGHSARSGRLRRWPCANDSHRVKCQNQPLTCGNAKTRPTRSRVSGVLRSELNPRGVE